MRGADRLEDTFPHGTVEGFNAGCRGGWCPEGNEHGLSCKKAKQLDAGDYRYQRLVKRGFTPGAIADELGLAPETHQPPKRKTVVPDDDTDDVADVEPEEEPTMVTKTAKTVQPAPKPAPPKPGPAKTKPVLVETTAQYQKRIRTETRAWAAQHGYDIATHGRIPQVVVYAFAKKDPTLLPNRPSETPAERPAGAPTHDEAPEAGAPVSEAQGAAEHDTEGTVVLDGRVEVFGELVVTDVELLPPDQHLIDVACLISERDTAEAALALTLQKWDAVTQQLRLEKVVNEVLRAAHNLHVRLLESASASAETSEQILDDYAAEIRRNHDEIARLRDELEQARQPWWKRAAS